jgi:predicted ATPase
LRNFIVENRRFNINAENCNAKFILLKDSWNDYSYTTLHKLFYIKDRFKIEEIGYLKIGMVGQSEGQESIGEHEFSQLGDNYFSLGQDASYYENIRKLPDDDKILLLKGLKDIVFSDDVHRLAIKELVYEISLTRNIDELQIESFRRALLGYSHKFSYTMQVQFEQELLHFPVNVQSNFPTNIHVIIGENGVGKSHFLRTVAEKMCNGEVLLKELSRNRLNKENKIESVIYINFSAFDSDIDDLLELKGFNYLGLHKKDGGFLSQEFLANEFSYALLALHSVGKMSYVKSVFAPLKSISYMDDLVSFFIINASNKEQLESKYLALSSGHRIVLHTLVLLMDRLKHGAATLFDEPEIHLHPPLLAAFLQSLNILNDVNNGIMLVATHSPIVVQETPHSNVLCLMRIDKRMCFQKLNEATYGENVSRLTRTIFGLTEVGFYKNIERMVDENILNSISINDFNNELGSEAIAFAWVKLMRLNNEG